MNFLIGLMVYACAAGAFYLFVSGRKKTVEAIEEVGGVEEQAIAKTVLFACSLLWPIMIPGLIMSLVKGRRI